MQINILILSFLISAFIVKSASGNDLPQSWLGSSPSMDLSFETQNKIGGILTTHDSILERLSQKYQNLDRFDLSLGVNSSGGIGIFSYGKSSSMEMIWSREDKEAKEPTVAEIEINPLSTEKEIGDDLVRKMEQILDFKRIRGRVKRRIIRTLYNDASKINTFVQTLYNTPQVGNWYVHGFWRNYYFSSSFGILESLNLGYDKRVRFRFKLNRAPYAANYSRSRVDNRILTGLMNTFNEISANENPDDQFEFYRVWASFDLSTSFDILIFSKSIGKGFLVDLRKNNDYYAPKQDGAKIVSSPVSYITNKINDVISNRLNDSDKTMQLDQVRYRFGVSKELDLSLISIEKEADLNFQFKRIKNKEISESVEKVFNLAEVKPAPLNLNERMKSLNQVDYRHRATFSFGLPFVNRVRLRPSYEYRYKVR